VSDDCSGGVPASLSLNGSANSDAATYSPDTSCSGSGSSRAHGSFVLHLSAPAKVNYHVDASVLNRIVLPGGSSVASASATIMGPAGLIASAGAQASGDNYPVWPRCTREPSARRRGTTRSSWTARPTPAPARAASVRPVLRPAERRQPQAHASITFTRTRPRRSRPSHRCPHVPVGVRAVLGVGAGAAPLAYRWQIEDGGAPGVWSNLSDGPLVIGGIQAAVISGAATPNLGVGQLSRFNLAFPSGRARFRCVLGNDCAARPATRPR